MDEILKDEYYNAKTGYQGFQKFYSKIKEKYPKFKLKDIKAFYDKQEINQISKPIQKIEHDSILALPRIYQMDITFLDDVFKPNKYLTLIEINSRKAFMYPISDRKDSTIVDVLQEFPETIKGLESDDEFNTRRVKNFCDEHDILLITRVANNEHITKHSGNPLGIIDRFTRTIKKMIYRYYNSTGNRYMRDTIPELLDNYNSSINNSGYKPNDVFKKPNLVNKPYVMSELKSALPLENGTRVRVAIQRHTFGKEANVFTKAIFKIDGTRGNKYIIKDGEDIKGYYRPNEILVVNETEKIPDDIKDSVEDDHKKVIIVRKKRREGIDEKNIIEHKRRI